MPSQACAVNLKSMCGTRDAASNWEECYTEALVSIGFTQGLSSPCIFHHKERNISTVVHGDDFTSLAEEKDLIWLKNKLSEFFLIKDRGILGPDPHDLKQIRLLNRIITWNSNSITFEADQRHGEILISALGLDGAKGVETPGTVDNKLDNDNGDDDDTPLDPHMSTVYRAGAARCNFLGLDRPDVQYSAKEVSRGMAKPTSGDLVRLKRLARYLAKYPRAVFEYKFQAGVKNIRVYSDSDWAGCIKTRKSTQGGVVMIGGCCIKSWASTQGLISLSSAEAEYYGIVKASSVGLGVKAMFRDLGYNFELDILTDASAAKGIASRRGLGKTRHIDVHYLWVQERVHRGDLTVSKCWGGENPADLMTKYLNRDKISKAMHVFGFKYLEGRAEQAPTVASICSLNYQAPHERW